MESALQLFTAGSIPRCSASCSFVCDPLPPLFAFLPVWPSPRRPRAACANVGVLGRRGCALESAAAHVCREACGRVSVNVAVRDLDIGVPDRADERRLEVVADGLPLFHGADCNRHDSRFCLAQGWNASSSMCERGWSRTGSGPTPQELRYPGLAGQHGRAKLVVLVGGRSEECHQFLCQLASAKTRNEPKVLRSRARQAWLHRRGSLLACSSARAFAMSLLESRGGTGADGPPPPQLTWCGRPVSAFPRREVARCVLDLD